MMTHDEFRAAAATIPYQYRHPQILYGLVRWLRPRAVVEVGCHIGMSTVWLARGLQENDADGVNAGETAQLWCIDNFCWTEHNQRAQWMANVEACGVADFVELLQGRSQDVHWPGRVDMAYVDGNHTYQVCVHDVQAAMARGAKCVCIHDVAQFDGPALTADWMRSEFADSWDFLEVMFDSGLFVAVKREARPSVEKYVEKWDKK